MNARPRLFTLALLGLTPLLLACGPWMPSILLTDDKQQAIRPPVAELAAELRRLPALPKLPLGIRPPPFDTEKYRHLGDGDFVLNRDEERDFQAALAYYQIPSARRSSLAAEYRAIRQITEKLREPLLGRPEIDPGKHVAFDALPLPADLPAEIGDYLQGAFAFHSGQIEEARTYWEHLLARPLAERRFRSVWAAYMLGRIAWWTAEDNEANRAVARIALQRVRTLAQEGCADGLNLVGESYFREGMLASDLEEEAQLYGLALAAGNPTAVNGLAIVADQLLESTDDALRERAVRSPLLRQVVTARLLARCGKHPLWDHRWRYPDEADRSAPNTDAARWLAAIEAAGLAGKLPDADRVAWLAYDGGDFTVAARWLKLAPDNAPLALWLRAKLALRAGRNQEAARCFTRSARFFTQPADELYPADEWWNAPDWNRPAATQARQWQIDRGITALARADFPLALDSLLRSGSWLDAAYVADQVMTTDELLAYVRKHFPDRPPLPPQPTEMEEDRWTHINFRQNIPVALRYLLARRLARDQRFAEARPFFPELRLARFDEYVAARRLGGNSRQPAEVRSAALWRAAGLHRYLGMEMFGTEAAPDWSFYLGYHADNDIGALRAGTKLPVWDQEAFKKTPWLPKVSPQEIARNRRGRPTPDQRFHYRYGAADLAWKAAHLRPADDECARMLCVAGSWLKRKDPQAANRFYQELVERCGETDLGQDAEIRRWFPPVEDEWSNLR